MTKFHCFNVRHNYVPENFLNLDSQNFLRDFANAFEHKIYVLQEMGFQI